LKQIDVTGTKHEKMQATKGAFHYAGPTGQRTSGTNEGKMERHCSKETKLPTALKRSIYASTKISITPQ